MAQESIPADSKKWDGKKIVLTDTTKKNMMKKAYILDAESLLAQQGGGIGGYQGEDAVKAVEARGMTQEQLVSTPQTYSNLAYEAILALEANEGKEARVAAIRAFQELNYTNIYDSTTQDFLTPPENKDEPEAAPAEAPAEAPTKPGPRSNPYYNKGAKVDARIEAAKKQAKAQSDAIRAQNERVRQQQDYEQQVAARESTMQQSQYVQNPAAQQQPRSNNFLSSLQPRLGRPVVQKTEVRNVGRGPMTNPNIGRVSVRPYVGRTPQSNVQSAPAEQRGPAPTMQRQVPQMGRTSLNPTMAAKFGSVGIGRKNMAPNPGMGGMGMGVGLRSSVGLGDRPNRANVIGKIFPKKK